MIQSDKIHSRRPNASTLTEVKPHRYSPDAMAQGDCRICGNVREAECHDDPRETVTRMIAEATGLHYLDAASLAVQIQTVFSRASLREVAAMPDSFMGQWQKVIDWCGENGETIEAQTAWHEVISALGAKNANPIQERPDQRS